VSELYLIAPVASIVDLSPVVPIGNCNAPVDVIVTTLFNPGTISILAVESVELMVLPMIEIFPTFTDVKNAAAGSTLPIIVLCSPPFATKVVPNVPLLFMIR
jgi:hypothetical protein